MLTLYQFAISHYCEKAKWALDYKGLTYQNVYWIPGPHLILAKKIAPKSSVPILQDGKKIIQDSTEIINYLDQHYPKISLSPQDPQLKQQALEWENYCNQEIGPHLRRFFYYHLLPHRQLVTSLLLQKSPAYGPLLYFFTFPIIRYLMKKSMNIHQESALRSKERLNKALKKLEQSLGDKKYLVGEHFSRADLTVASLLAPLFRPPQHPLLWPAQETLPPALQEYTQDLESSRLAEWVRGLYAFHRKKDA
ncbi:MAG: glutathione S-transferase family protein [Deltaproteobacteria bacterium]|nr:glutathione S-transferase family protein [Deltaproteobacteria bacterium]